MIDTYYTLLNHETGDTALVRGKNAADKVLSEWLSQEVDYENITIVKGKRVKVDRKLTYEYTIED